MEAKNGKDIAIPLGKNVKLDSDGLTVLAAVNGQVLLVNDKITVEPLMELDSVNIKTGNITFLGTVIVKGNVEDGFDVHASGNIEVHGSVGSSKLESPRASERSGQRNPSSSALPRRPKPEQRDRKSVV